MSDDTELVFSSDFTARVLGEADRLVAWRRKRRGLAAFAATAAASGAVFLWLIVFPVRPDTGPSAAVPRLEDVQIGITSARSDEPDALGYLFPDAASVAQFAAQYSDANEPAADLLGDEDADAR